MRYSDVASEKDAPESAAGMRPNMRLKVTGPGPFDPRVASQPFTRAEMR